MGEPTPPNSGKAIGGNVRVNKELFEHVATHIMQLKKTETSEEGGLEAARKRERSIFKLVRCL